MSQRNRNDPVKKERRRTGYLYTEIQRNTGRGSGELHSGRLVSGVGYVETSRIRWVAVIYYHGTRYRFRSTNYGNVRRWLEAMVGKFN